MKQQCEALWPLIQAAARRETKSTAKRKPTKPRAKFDRLISFGRALPALRARRDALQNHPDAYVFGTASGFRQQHFQWHRLFKLAGINLGRDKGVVWHSLRHEFCSRTAENTGDPVVAQELARHKDLRTTQGYLHARRARVLAGAVSLDRSRRIATDSVHGR